MQKLMLGAGCFWGVEHKFKKSLPIEHIAVGYSGGNTKNPNYEQVCQNNTGHAEVVFIEYDENRVKLEDILMLFWKIHDPTQLNRQGVDVGSQYRSVIFYYTDIQKQKALESKELAQNNFSEPIVTEILPAKEFWRAEEYHQCYIEKNEKL